MNIYLHLIGLTLPLHSNKDCPLLHPKYEKINKHVHVLFAGVCIDIQNQIQHYLMVYRIMLWVQLHFVKKKWVLTTLLSFICVKCVLVRVRVRVYAVCQYAWFTYMHKYVFCRDFSPKLFSFAWVCLCVCACVCS